MGRGGRTCGAGSQRNLLEFLTALFSQFWPFLSTYKNRVQVRACFLLVALQPEGWAAPELGLAPQGGEAMLARVLVGSQGGLVLFCEAYPPTPSDRAVAQ